MRGVRSNPRREPSGPQSAFIYARVSSKDQEKEGFSIPAQLKLLREYAAAHRLSVKQEFTDVETAKHSGRTAFNAMVAELRKPSAKGAVLLVEKTDRLYRNFRDYVTLDELGVAIHLVKENAVISQESKSGEKFMHGIKVLMAKNFIDNLSEETRKGMMEKAAQGIWPSFAPLGYRNVLRTDGKRYIEPDPATSPLVTRMFEDYATGGYSLKEITQAAREGGLRYRRSRNGIPSATIHVLLKNPIYFGDFEWKGRRYKGIHQPLISRDLWERVQFQLKYRGKRNIHPVKHFFAFSGLIACGHCGCAITAERQGRYIYYHCTGYHGHCPERYVREEVLAEQFGQALKRLRLDDEVADWIATALRESHAQEKQAHEEAVARLQAEYGRLQDRLDAMYVDKLDGRIGEEFYDQRAREWRTEQDNILRDIEAHQGANRSYLDEGVRIIELAKKAHLLYERQETGERRKLLRFLVSSATWKDGALSVEYRQPFDLLVDSAAAAQAGAAGDDAKTAKFENWRPRMEAFRRTCGNPTAAFRTAFSEIFSPLRKPQMPFTFINEERAPFWRCHSSPFCWNPAANSVLFIYRSLVMANRLPRHAPTESIPHRHKPTNCYA